MRGAGGLSRTAAAVLAVLVRYVPPWASREGRADGPPGGGWRCPVVVVGREVGEAAARYGLRLLAAAGLAAVEGRGANRKAAATAAGVAAWNSKGGRHP